MIKKLLFLISLCFVAFAPIISVADDFEDDFDFDDDYSVIETSDEDTDVNVDGVSLNSGAGSVDVKHFDIAGVMLGMNYEEIYNLFFNNSSLYAPKKKNSIVYTINKEWNYNLDYDHFF